MEKKLLRAEEVAVLVDISLKTLQNWYQFKKEYPENEYSQMLPDFTQSGERQTRYWTTQDVWKLIEFKQKLPRGRGGVLSKVTQKYYHRKKKDGGKKDVTESKETVATK